jgi:uncharacterized protein
MPSFDTRSSRPASHTAQSLPVTLAGTALSVTVDGGLWQPDERLLVVSDLHLEKGSSFAARGRLLPPYDTKATLARLEDLVKALNPAVVIALGDSFHDVDAAARLDDVDRRQLARIMTGRRWIWIAGNHDPIGSIDDIGGEVHSEISFGPLTYRHEPAGGAVGTADAGQGEVAGHFHPKTTIRTRLARFSGPCFVHDAARLVMPAFGAFTGGLDIGDPAIRSLFPQGGRAIALIRRRMIFQVFC